ncbi:DEAD/DEAH box helicase [Azospirillum canadense]|uniref:DEAD/DEAH box helicase n=1 Tax=Azospirillum canadense TaxID=403962 RepID=UPI0022275B7F|nr:DEAD/DEAH box helicase [Azospirillum canadense]MCW2240687.1 superfamily II DNA or RNA helicase [Azospirillum canadense]
MVTVDNVPANVLDALERLGVGRGPRDVLGSWTSERGRIGTAAVRLLCDAESSAAGDGGEADGETAATVRARVVVEGRIVSPSYRAGMTADQVRVALGGLGWSAATVGREVGVLLNDGGAAIPAAVVEAWADDGVEAERGGSLLWALLAEFAPATLRRLQPPAMVLPVVVPLVPMSSARGRHAAARREIDAVWPDLCGPSGTSILDGRGTSVAAAGRIGDAEVVVRAEGAVVVERTFVFAAMAGGVGMVAPAVAYEVGAGGSRTGSGSAPGRGKSRHDEDAPAVKAEAAPEPAKPRLTEPVVTLDVTEADQLVVRMLVEGRGPRSTREVAACLRALHMDGREVLADLCRTVPEEFRDAVEGRWSAWLSGEAPVVGPMADALIDALAKRVGWFFAARVEAERVRVGGPAFAKAAVGRGHGSGYGPRGESGEDAVVKPWWLAAVGPEGVAAQGGGRSGRGRGGRGGLVITADLTVRMPNGSSEWFDLGVGVKVGGRYVSLLPILVSLIEAGGLEAAVVVDNHVRIALDTGHGDVLALPVARVEAMLSALDYMLDGAVRRRDTVRVPARFVDAMVDIADMVDTDTASRDAAALLATSLESARDATGAVRPSRTVAVPAAFLGDLRRYQREGLEWLQALRERGEGGVLADDMGLGKTIQTLVHVAVEKQEKRLTTPVLVVVPTSLVPNWLDEAKRFTPDLRVVVRHGVLRSPRLALEDVDVVVTTYGVAAREVALLKPVAWHAIILDEAQAIKNPDSQAAQAMRSLRARHRVCLTGTPVENNLEELWSQFAFLMPGFLDDRAAFGRLYRGPIERRQDGHRMALLKRRIGPYMLRRTKEQVATELPPKTEVAVRVELGQGQRDLYETIRMSVHKQVRAAVETKGLARSAITVLDALLRLRQVCCDPRLARMGVADSEGGDDRAALDEPAVEQDHGAATAVAGTAATPDTAAADGGGTGRQDAATERTDVQSAKLDALIDMVVEMVPEGRRILLFSQFTSMLDLIKPRLAAEGVRYVELTGKTQDRETPVRRFQAGEVPVFLLSLKAGGRGLNLTAADTVIHYDPWWNPAVESQATDRAYRIGQDKPVFVYKLIATDTVEERILDLQARKGSLAAAVVGDAGAIGPLDGRDLDYLFGAADVSGGAAERSDRPIAPYEAARGGGVETPSVRALTHRARAARRKIAGKGGVGIEEVAPSTEAKAEIEAQNVGPAASEVDGTGISSFNAIEASTHTRVDTTETVSSGDKGSVDAEGAGRGPGVGRGPVPLTGREALSIIEALGIDGEQAVEALRQVVGEGWRDRLGAYWAAWEEERTRVPRPLGEAIRDLPRMLDDGAVVLAPFIVVGSRGLAQRLLTRRQAPATWEEVAALAVFGEVPAVELVAAMARRMGADRQTVAATWNKGMRKEGDVPAPLGQSLLAEVLERPV